MWNPFKRKPKRLGELMDAYLSAGERIFGVGYNERSHREYEELRAAVGCRDDESLVEGIHRLAAHASELESVLLKAQHAIVNCTGSRCHTVTDLIDETINP